jgi:hypothetical protein
LIDKKAALHGVVFKKFFNPLPLPHTKQGALFQNEPNLRRPSGFAISDCALASAAARAPTLSLELRIAGLLNKQFEADRPGFGASLKTDWWSGPIPSTSPVLRSYHCRYSSSRSGGRLACGAVELTLDVGRSYLIETAPLDSSSAAVYWSLW